MVYVAYLVPLRFLFLSLFSLYSLFHSIFHTLSHSFTPPPISFNCRVAVPAEIGSTNSKGRTSATHQAAGNITRVSLGRLPYSTHTIRTA